MASAPRTARTAAALVTALVALGALLPAAPIRDAADGAPVMGASLALPAGYVALSPLARALDALCLLSPPQHAALLATLALAWTVWRVARARRRARALALGAGGARARLGRWAREARLAAGALAVVVAVYALGALAPRPMAALAVDDPDLVRVDLHAHTSASHDVSRRFDVAARRAWARAAGYDLAFLTDHRSFAAHAEAHAGNPVRAGDDVVLQPGLEAWLGPVHVLVLGVTAADTALLAAADVARTLPAAMRDGRLPGGGRPVSILAIPDAVLPVMSAALRDGPFALRGVEVADGAPRAVAQADRERDAIAARAAALGLLPIAASNHHGWGRTASGWTLVRVPGWRALAPDALGARVLDVLGRADRAAVTPVVRARPRAAGTGLARAAALAATAPAVVWTAARTLTPAERGAWLAWAWGLALAPAWAAALGRERRVRMASRRALGVDPAAA